MDKKGNQKLFNIMFIILAAIFVIFIPSAKVMADTSKDNTWIYEKMNDGNGDYAVITDYKGDTNLTEITIPDSIDSIPVKSIKGYLDNTFKVISPFSNCTKVTSITIPNSVTSIGKLAFCDCSSLSSIEIPNSVSSIGAGAFGRCSNLGSITIADSVNSIGNSAFSHCSNLGSIEIPNSVSSIEEKTFWYCSKLSSIKIPNSVSNIEDGAFENCSILSNITISNSSANINGDNVFKETASGLTITTYQNNGTNGNNVKSYADSKNIKCNVIKDPPTNATVEASASTLTPEAGADNTITLMVKDSAGNIDSSFSGTKAVEISGVKPAPNKTHGNITHNNGTIDDFNEELTSVSETTGQVIQLNFTNGQATCNLKLNDAENQSIEFYVVGVTEPYANTLIIKPKSGTAASIGVIIQSVVGTASGDTFKTQPVVALKDSYGNICSTGASATANVTASAKAGTGSWTIGGTTTRTAVVGIATFNDLTCTLVAAGNGAITFTSGTINVDSDTFTIPGAPTVSTYSPVNNATEVSSTENLVLTFDENVTAVTGKNIVIKKASDNSTVETIDAADGRITVSGKTVTINPSAALESGTAYYIQIEAGAFENGSNNSYGGIADTTTWKFTVADTTAPSWLKDYPKKGTVNASSVQILGKINKTGKVYWVCLSESSTAPTAAQVKAGQDSTGNTAGAGMSGNIDLTADTEGSFTVSGLSASTGYNIYVVAEDGVPNLQAAVVTINRAAAVPNNSTITPVAANFDKYTSGVNYKDIVVTVDLNGNTLSSIKNGTTATGRPAGAALSSTIAYTATPYIPPYVPPYIPPTPKPTTETRQVPVVVDNEGKQGTSVQTTITRTTDTQGVKTDTVKFDENTAAEAVKKASETKSTRAAIDIADTSGKSADRTEFQLPAASMGELAKQSMSLDLKTEKAALEIPAGTIGKLGGQDAVVKMSEEKDSSKIENNKGMVLKLSSGAQIISAPLNIEANYTGRTKITIPIDSSKLPSSKEELDKFLSSLAVMVHHSDGEDVVDKGTIVYDEKGNAVGISIYVNKFSSFTLIEMPKDYFNGKTTVVPDKVDENKEWHLKFTKAADPSTVTSDNIYVTDLKGNKVDVKVSCDSDDVIKVSPVNPYKSGETYYIYISKKVTSKYKEPLTEDLTYEFTVK